MSTNKETIKMLRRAERKVRQANDPYFGRKRPAGTMGNHKTKAAKSKKACRGKVSW